MCQELAKERQGSISNTLKHNECYTNGARTLFLSNYDSATLLTVNRSGYRQAESVSETTARAMVPKGTRAPEYDENTCNASHLISANQEHQPHALLNRLMGNCVCCGCSCGCSCSLSFLVVCITFRQGVRSRRPCTTKLTLIFIK